MIKKNIILFCTALALLCSCSLLHNEKAVAKIGEKKLYAKDVVALIPPGTAEQDSLEMARKYINSWAADIILYDMALQKLPESERDITKEVEQYKRSLLKYRYEQHYIAENLDTTVTWNEIQEYYDANPALYKLERPILKANYAKFPSSIPLKEEIVALLSSDSDEDMAKLDSLSQTVVTRFQTFGGKWVDIISLAKEYGMDYGSLIAAKKGEIIEIEDEQGQSNIAYLSGYIPTGQIAPLEYCADAVRKAIINKRKHTLFSNLEQELLKDAINKGKLEIYE